MHEGAVVHTFTVPVTAALAWAEREGGVGGHDFLTGLALGVDVACHLGVASKSPLRFFRTATAGAFGAAAAIGRLAGFDAATLVNAFGAVLGQLSGTMQAHVEGSPLLGMQVGFGARNAIVACDMAARGLAAPQAVLEGPFGFFRLFEGEHTLEAVLGELGRTWRVTEVSHEPYPCGRATHAVIDACLGFRERRGLDRAGRDAVEQVTARVPPLVHRLVGRTVTEDMDVNCARLCCRYVAVSSLLRGGGEADRPRGGGAGHRRGGASRVAPRRDRPRRRSRSRSRHPSATRLNVWPPARWEDTSELTYDPSSIGKRRESKSGAFGRGYG